MRFVTALRSGEDAPALTEALRCAKEWVLDGRVELLLHGEHRQELDAETKAEKHQQRLELLRAALLKRYVFRIETPVGPRIVKIAEVVTLGNAVDGLLRRSGPRREHADHARASELGLTVTESCGFIEQYDGPLLRRSCQIQTLLPATAITWTTFLEQERARVGIAAVDGAAWAMADMHRRHFFHGDLKGFHAFIDPLEQRNGEAAHYTLKWLDLGRVGFRLSRRQRIINLYQVLRYVLPDDPQGHARFIDAYCQATGWYAHKPGHAFAIVSDFLAYKLRTHPAPLD